jgi:hypothetical protein
MRRVTMATRDELVVAVWAQATQLGLTRYFATEASAEFDTT